MKIKFSILILIITGFLVILPAQAHAFSIGNLFRSLLGQTRTSVTAVSPTRVIACPTFNSNNYVPSGATLDSAYPYDLNSDNQNEYVVKFKRQLAGSATPDFGYKLMACENGSWVPRKEDTSFVFQEYNFDLLTSPRALFISPVASGAGTATGWEISVYKGTGFGISTNGGSVVRDQALTSKCLVYQGYSSVQVIQPNKIQEILPGYRPTDSRCCPTGQSITANYSFNLYGTGYGLQIDSISGNSSCSTAPAPTTAESRIIAPTTPAPAQALTCPANIYSTSYQRTKYAACVQELQKKLGVQADGVMGSGSCRTLKNITGFSCGAPYSTIATKLETVKTAAAPQKGTLHAFYNSNDHSSTPTGNYVPLSSLALASHGNSAIVKKIVFNYPSPITGAPDFYLMDHGGSFVATGVAGIINPTLKTITFNLPTTKPQNYLVIPSYGSTGIFLVSIDKTGVFDPQSYKGIDISNLEAISSAIGNQAISCSKIFLPAGNNSCSLTAPGPDTTPL